MCHGRKRMPLTFLSTPSARRATLLILVSLAVLKISIHALREEGDVKAIKGDKVIGYFYPRPPRGGRPGVDFG